MMETSCSKRNNFDQSEGMRNNRKKVKFTCLVGLDQVLFCAYQNIYLNLPYEDSGCRRRSYHTSVA
jgi:hypothetical protein